MLRWLIFEHWMFSFIKLTSLYCRLLCRDSGGETESMLLNETVPQWVIDITVDVSFPCIDFRFCFWRSTTKSLTELSLNDMFNFSVFHVLYFEISGLKGCTQDPWISIVFWSVQLRFFVHWRLRKGAQITVHNGCPFQVESSGTESNLYIAAVFSYYLISFEVNNNYIQKVDMICISLKLEHIRSVSSLEAVCGSCLLRTSWLLIIRNWLYFTYQMVEMGAYDSSF